MRRLAYDALDTALGPVVVVVSARGLVAIGLAGARQPDAAVASLRRSLPGDALTPHPTRLLARAKRQLSEYFSGSRTQFSLPLDLDGHHSPFARQVWGAIAAVPYGATLSYGKLAEAIGRPKATRAVAAACGRNPVPIVVPCHRIIESSGGLGGFSAGLPLKRRLLTLERGAAADLPLFAAAAAQDIAQRTQEAGRAALAQLQQGLASWLQAKLQRDPALATAWMTIAEWADAVFAALSGDALAALTGWVVAQAGDAGPGDALHQLCHELLDMLVNPALLSRASPPSLWATALRTAFALRASVEIERIAAQFLGDPEPATTAVAEVEDVLQDVLGGALATSPALRERAVDLWLELQAHAPPSAPPSTVVESTGAAPWGSDLVQDAERRLASGEGDRLVTLAELAHIYESTGETEAAIEKLQALWLETGQLRYVTRLKALREKVTARHADGVEASSDHADGDGDAAAATTREEKNAPADRID